ncbi:hypothetical protein TNCV_3925851 [Trichonephila clavipes]|nr:hypothetical protein TNCV_3925851 [Trichonephila clavipes]
MKEYHTSFSKNFCNTHKTKVIIPRLSEKFAPDVPSPPNPDYPVACVREASGGRIACDPGEDGGPVAPGIRAPRPIDPYLPFPFVRIS